MKNSNLFFQYLELYTKTLTDSITLSDVERLQGKTLALSDQEIKIRMAQIALLETLKRVFTEMVGIDNIFPQDIEKEASNYCPICARNPMSFLKLVQ